MAAKEKFRRGEDGKWSARFARATDAAMRRFNASVAFDQRLAEWDIQGSLAHAEMLAAQGIISAADLRAIRRGFRRIAREIAAGEFEWREEDEDVHMNLERRLTELVGAPGRRLHTARSRNDQVAADLRLFVRDRIDILRDRLRTARLELLTLAEAHTDTLMPGFTHLQPAQPVAFAHHLLAYDAMLARDMRRLTDCRAGLNYSPLGAAALAGTPHPIRPEMTAKLLDFAGPCRNSIDAVSDRDFVAEFIFAAALMMTHFSRLCEEVILWMSPAFGFVALDDSFCTGSSVMPQKKNPDVPELIRGKCGRVCGALTAILTLLKAQPLAYNKDNQEDKPPLFDCADAAVACAEMLAAMIRALRPRPERMRAALNAGHLTATELADYLTRRGAPFRDAHGMVAALVRDAEERGVGVADLSLADIRRRAPMADADALPALDPARAVAARRHIGGTAPSRIRAEIAAARKELRAEKPPRPGSRKKK